MKNRWFFEELHSHIKVGLKIKKTVFRQKTSLQDIEILDTYEFGRALILDKTIQTTEKDEAFYHEMLTHIPLLSHPRAEKVLIIGGGDGGVLREVLRYKTVKKAVLVEIDEKVIKLSQKYLPFISQKAFADPRTQIIIEDGAEFVKNTKEKFDAVLIDSPDPIGPAKVLFSSNFYHHLHKIMKPQSLLARQSGSSILQKEELRSNFRLLKKEFKYANIYLSSVPTYIGGLFSFVMASDKIDPRKINLATIKRKAKFLRGKTVYFNPDIWQAAFSLPEYARRIAK